MFYMFYNVFKFNIYIEYSVSVVLTSIQFGSAFYDVNNIFLCKIPYKLFCCVSSSLGYQSFIVIQSTTSDHVQSISIITRPICDRSGLFYYDIIQWQWHL